MTTLLYASIKSVPSGTRKKLGASPYDFISEGNNLNPKKKKRIVYDFKNIC